MEVLPDGLSPDAEAQPTRFRKNRRAEISRRRSSEVYRSDLRRKRFWTGFRTRRDPLESTHLGLLEQVIHPDNFLPMLSLWSNIIYILPNKALNPMKMFDSPDVAEYVKLPGKKNGCFIKLKLQMLGWSVTRASNKKNVLFNSSGTNFL